MVGREVDVGDGSVMGTQCVLYRGLFAVVGHGQVVHEGELVARRGNPLGPRGKGRPLHIGDMPRRLIREEERERVGIV